MATSVLRPGTPARPARSEPLNRARSVSRPVRFPSPLRLVDAVHTASFSPLVVGVDVAAVLVAALLVAPPAWLALAVATAIPAAFTLSRVYRARCSLETQGIHWYARVVVSPLAVITAAASVATDDPARSLRFLAVVALLAVGIRALTWSVLFSARRAGLGLRRTLVIGQGETVRIVARKLAEYPEAGLVPVGILSANGDADTGEGVGLGALPADLPAIIAHASIENVVLVPEGNHDSDIAGCLDRCDGLDVDFALLPPLSELYLHPTLVTQVGGLPLIPLGRVARTRRSLPGKRSFDIAVALAGLLLAAPLVALTAIAVWLGDRGPILYRQKRVGQGGRVFEMLKFRSMVVGADRLVVDLRDRNVTDGLLFKVDNDPRITPVGRIIRRLSIDELPQLLNVIRGDMSIVGPRPLPVDPGEFGALDGKRHSVPPGITGYWQIAGGNGLSYAEMVKLDLSYVQNWTLWLDLRLMARTIPALFHRRGPA
jgi:exopolysaccharide biosynthesis polyprenyl glycosylphosphotransferase